MIQYLEVLLVNYGGFYSCATDLNLDQLWT